MSRFPLCGRAAQSGRQAVSTDVPRAKDLDVLAAQCKKRRGPHPRQRAPIPATPSPTQGTDPAPIQHVSANPCTGHRATHRGFEPGRPAATVRATDAGHAVRGVTTDPIPPPPAAGGRGDLPDPARPGRRRATEGGREPERAPRKLHASSSAPDGRFETWPEHWMSQPVGPSNSPRNVGPGEPRARRCRPVLQPAQAAGVDAAPSAPELPHVTQPQGVAILSSPRIVRLHRTARSSAVRQTPESPHQASTTCCLHSTAGGGLPLTPGRAQLKIKPRRLIKAPPVDQDLWPFQGE